MNKHIELVKKWLDDPDSVTEAELRKNVPAALTAAEEASDATDAAARAARAVFDMADDASSAANKAAYFAAHGYSASVGIAKYYVDRYEELTK